MRLIPRLLLLSLLSLGLLCSCLGGAKRLQVDYVLAASGSAGIEPGSVRLVTADLRADKSLLGPGALAKDLFKGSRGGLIDLKLTLPSGQTASRSSLTAERAVYEAVKEKLRLLGIMVDGDKPKCLVTININELNIDVTEDGDLAARVTLEAVMTNLDRSLTTRSWMEAESGQKRLIGDMGGSEVLSKALSKAADGLNFSSLNRFGN
jgi:hypothetical protein